MACDFCRVSFFFKGNKIMNTLSKNITEKFFVDPSNYKLFINRWKSLVKSEHGKNLAAVHFYWFLVITGKNYKKAFYPGRPMEYYGLPQGLYNAIHDYKYLENRKLFNDVFGEFLVPNWEILTNTVTQNLKSFGKEYSYFFEERDAYCDEEIQKVFFKDLEVLEPSVSKNSIAPKSFFQKLKVALGINA